MTIELYLRPVVRSEYVNALGVRAVSAAIAARRRISDAECGFASGQAVAAAVVGAGAGAGSETVVGRRGTLVGRP